MEAPGLGERHWTAEGIDPGVYVVALRASDRARKESLVETRALRIAGPVP